MGWQIHAKTEIITANGLFKSKRDVLIHFMSEDNQINQKYRRQFIGIDNNEEYLDI